MTFNYASAKLKIKKQNRRNSRIKCRIKLGYRAIAAALPTMALANNASFSRLWPGCVVPVLAKVQVSVATDRRRCPKPYAPLVCTVWVADGQLSHVTLGYSATTKGLKQPRALNLTQKTVS